MEPDISLRAMPPSPPLYIGPLRPTARKKKKIKSILDIGAGGTGSWWYRPCQQQLLLYLRLNHNHLCAPAPQHVILRARSARVISDGPTRTVFEVTIII